MKHGGIKQKKRIERRPRGEESHQRPAPKREEESNEPIRLNKFLADAGVSSRRKADDLISSGAVKVNGQVVTELGSKVTRSDFITVSGDPIRENVQHIYILLNKPKDYITTTSDEKDRKTVLDIVKKQTRIFPVGRLDRNTTGALLLTNDGELAHRLTHPSYRIERVYVARLDKPLALEDAKRISEGVELEDGRTSPCEVLAHPGELDKVTLSLHEGRNREIKRIFETLGYDVKQLDRKFFAGLSASGMKRGEYRHLTAKEVRELKKIVNLSK